MARSIFRSGRVVYVWHRNVPAASGFYALVRGGSIRGPYQDRHHIGPGITNTVVTTPRRSADHIALAYEYLARAVDSARLKLARVCEAALGSAQESGHP